MAKFSAYSGAITPTIGANNNNLNLMGTALSRVIVQDTSWGGSASASTPMETAWQRTSNTGASPPAGIVIQSVDHTAAGGNSANCYGGAAWVTGPTRVAGSLFGVEWNAYGGFVRWLASPGEEWDLCLTQNGLLCVPIVGTGQSSYHVIWSEL